MAAASQRAQAWAAEEASKQTSHENESVAAAQQRARALALEVRDRNDVASEHVFSVFFIEKHSFWFCFSMQSSVLFAPNFKSLLSEFLFYAVCSLH